MEGAEVAEGVGLLAGGAEATGLVAMAVINFFFNQ